MIIMYCTFCLFIDCLPFFKPRTCLTYGRVCVCFLIMEIRGFRLMVFGFEAIFIMADGFEAIEDGRTLPSRFVIGKWVLEGFLMNVLFSSGFWCWIIMWKFGKKFHIL